MGTLVVGLLNTKDERLRRLACKDIIEYVLRQVQKQLGHSSPATTANMYADISFEDMQDGLNGLYQ